MAYFFGPPCILGECPVYVGGANPQVGVDTAKLVLYATQKAQFQALGNHFSKRGSS